MTIGIYVRVSSGGQDTKSQEGDLKTWAAAQTEEVKWYRDKATGTKMERPGLDSLLADVRAGAVTKVVVWRLDRLGRLARGLLNLFHDLEQAKCGFFSLRDSIDLSTASGRLLLVVLSGVAAFETEVRGERQRAGIERVKAEMAEKKRAWFKNGTPRRPPKKLDAEKLRTIKTLDREGASIAAIARQVGLCRKSVYQALGRWPVLPRTNPTKEGQTDAPQAQ